MNITLCMLLDTLIATHPEVIIRNYHSCPVRGVKLLPPQGDAFAAGHLNVGIRDGRAVLLCGEGMDLGIETDIAFEVLFNELQDSYTALRNWDMEMHLLLLRGGSLGELLDISSDVLQNPITIMNPGFKLLAHTRKIKSDSQIYNDVLKYGCLPERIIKRHEKAGVFPAMQEDVATRLILDASDHVTVIQAVYVEHRIVGQVTMPCTGRMYSEGLAEQFCALIANIETIFENDIHNRTLNQYMHEFFLVDLIESGRPDDDSFAERLKYIGLEARGNFTLLNIRQGRRAPYLNEYHAGRLSGLLPGAHVFALRGELCVLMDEKKHAGAAEECARGAPEKLQKFLTKEGLLCGISGRFEELTEIRHAYLQAGAALDLGSRISTGRALEKLGIASLHYPQDVFYYDDYRLHHMIDSCARQMPLESLCDPRLLSLMETDKRESANNCEVLYHFLLLERRTTETAAFLHMHRNSVIYRIGKIEEMLASSLNDAKLRRQLMISFAVVELMV